MSDNTTPAEFRLYQYTPSAAAAIVAVVVFSFLTAGHIWKIHRYGTRYFIPFAVGGVFQVVGYCGRLWSHFDSNSIGGFVMQALLILLAPALFAASIYMILGRLIGRLGADNLSLVPLRWLTKIFVSGDVLSFTLQLAGGGLQAAGTLELLSTGRNIIIAGLAIQIAFFSLFVITAVVFHRRAKQASIQNKEIPWIRHLAVLYTSSALILVRSIFRIIEYAEGNTGYLISNEVFLYIFDFVLMVTVMIILLVWYVSDLQKQTKSTHYEQMHLSSIDP